MLKIFLPLALLCGHLTALAQVQGKLLAHWADSTLVSSSAHDNTYNEVWGYAQNGREYAIIGSTRGTHFFDVTNPEQMVEVAEVQGAAQGRAIIHRDFHNLGQYLYAVADEGSNSTLQIIDMSTLPDSVSVVYNSRTLINRAHNIFIDTVQQRLYSLSSRGQTTGYSPMTVFDISDPLNPTLLKGVRNFDGYSIGHVHDAFVDNGFGYFNCGGDGLVIADVTDIENMDIKAIFTATDYPQSGYNHSGWPTEDGQYYYMADETFGSDMKVFDMADLDEIRVIGTFNSEVNKSAIIPHNQLVHNGYLYVSYYFDGLRVYDLEDPAVPELIMYYPTSVFPHTNGLYRGSWGVYPFLPSGNIIVSDMQEGLFIVEGINPSTSTQDLALASINLSPNPASDHLQVDLGDENWSSYAIYTLTGKVVQTGQNSNGHIDLNAGLSDGTYVISCMTDRGPVSRTFIIKK